MEYEKSVHTKKTPAEAVAAIEEALLERKFSVLWHLNMNEKLKEKGFDLGPEVHVLEVCSAPRAKHALETNPNVAYFLPCKVVVQSENGKTRIGYARPSLLIDVLGEERLSDLAAEVETVLAAAIEAAK